jgi:hypothetical protein
MNTFNCVLQLNECCFFEERRRIMKMFMKLLVVVLVLAWCSTAALALSAVVPADNSTWSFKKAPDWIVWPAGYDGDFLECGNQHGINGDIYAAYTQLDLSAYAGMTATSDGTLTLWSKKKFTDHQNGGYDVTELTKDYTPGEVNWNQASIGDPWTVSGSSYWDKAGWGDKGTVIGHFDIDTADWTMKTMTVPQAWIQSRLGDGTISLLFAPTYDGFYAYVSGHIGAEAPPEGSGPITLTFDYIPEPATMVLLGLGGLLIRRRRS